MATGGDWHVGDIIAIVTGQAQYDKEQVKVARQQRMA